MASVYSYVREYMGKIVLLIGLALLVIGVLTLNRFGSVLSAGTFFFGIIFILSGLLLQVGFFSENLRSLGGVGTILICVSIAFLAFSVVVFQFLKITSIEYAPVIFRGAFLGFYHANITSERMYAWVSAVFMQSGFGLLVAGIALRILSRFA